MPDIIDVIGKIRGTGLDFPIFPDVVPIDFNSDCWKYKLMSKAIQHTKDGQDMIIESWRVNLYTKANYTATIDQPYESTYGSTHVFIGQDVAGINGRLAELTDGEFEARITGIKEYYEEFTDDNVFEFDVLIINNDMPVVLFSDTEAWTGSRYNGDKVYVKTFVFTQPEMISSLYYVTDIVDGVIKKILGINGLLTNPAGASVSDWSVFLDPVSTQVSGQSNAILYNSLGPANVGQTYYITVYYTKN